MLTYTYRYNRVIKWFKDHPVSKETQYCELHHIKPRSCKGTNDKENLILLPGRWHYIVHCWLPYVMLEQGSYYGYRKMIRSWALMNGMIKFKNILKEDSNTYADLRKRYSIEMSKQMLENCHIKNSIWINNGKKNQRISNTEIIPDGWQRGRLHYSRTNKDLLGKKWCHNPITKEMRFIMKDQKLPEGFVYGRINVNYNSEKLAVVKGKIRITNGLTDKYIEPDDDIPKGWRRGLKIKGRPKAKNISHKRFWTDLRIKDRRWITNGMENKFLYKEDIQKYLDNGWKLGAIHRTYKKSVVLREQLQTHK